MKKRNDIRSERSRESRDNRESQAHRSLERGGNHKDSCDQKQKEFRKPTAEESLRREERISEISSMKHMKDFDAKREAKLEDFQARTNAKGLEKQQEHHGVDRFSEQQRDYYKNQQEQRHAPRKVMRDKYGKDQ